MPRSRQPVKISPHSPQLNAIFAGMLRAAGDPAFVGPSPADIAPSPASEHRICAPSISRRMFRSASVARNQRQQLRLHIDNEHARVVGFISSGLRARDVDRSYRHHSRDSGVRNAERGVHYSLICQHRSGNQ